MEVRTGWSAWRWGESQGRGAQSQEEQLALLLPCHLPSPGVLAGSLSFLILIWLTCEVKKRWKLPLDTAWHILRGVTFFLILLQAPHLPQGEFQDSFKPYFEVTVVGAKEVTPVENNSTGLLIGSALQ